MATFSENQVRQLYVAYKVADPATEDKLGNIKTKADKDHETIWFDFIGKGGRVSSDKIKVANIVDARATKSSSMVTKPKRVKISLSSEALAAGQDYILKVIFRQFVGMSDADMYYKNAAVHATSTMTPDQFYKALALALAQNISKENSKLLSIYVHSAAKGADHKNTSTKVGFTKGLMEVTPRTKDNGKSDVSNPFYVETTYVNDIDSIILEEVAQPWVLGKIEGGIIPFTVSALPVKTEADPEFAWAKIEKDAPGAAINNGHQIADLEWFCMGERADLYRGIGYPHNLDTEYMVDSNKGYDVVDITYFYAGDNEDIQRSQKTVTIVCDNAGGSSILTALVADINAATANKPKTITVPEE